MEEQTMAIERLLAAIVLDAGGELRVPYDRIVEAHSNDEDQFLSMSIVDAGQALLLEIVNKEDVPDDISNG